MRTAPLAERPCGGGVRLRLDGARSSAATCGAAALPRLRSLINCAPTVPLLPMMLLMRLPIAIASGCDRSGRCIAHVTRQAAVSYVSSAYPSFALTSSGFLGS